MKGLIYFDAAFYGNWLCANCGHSIQHYEAWVYKEDSQTLPFCSVECRDNFLQLNQMKDIGCEK